MLALSACGDDGPPGGAATRSEAIAMYFAALERRDSEALALLTEYTSTDAIRRTLARYGGKRYEVVRTTFGSHDGSHDGDCASDPGGSGALAGAEVEVRVLAPGRPNPIRLFLDMTVERRRCFIVLE